MSADRTLCPPHRAGPLHRATSRADLARFFGADRLQDRAIDVGEGVLQPGTLVDAGADSRVTIVWRDSTRTGITALLDLGPAWRTPHGLGVGSSLSEIQSALGPIDVLGFGWDHGGTVVLTDTELADRGLFFRTAPRDDAARASDAYRRVQGDRPYAADDPHVRALDLVVRRVDVLFR